MGGRQWQRGALTITATLCVMGPGAIRIFFIPECFQAHFAPPDVKLDSPPSNREAPVATSLNTTTVLEWCKPRTACVAWLGKVITCLKPACISRRWPLPSYLTYMNVKLCKHNVNCNVSLLYLYSMFVLHCKAKANSTIRFKLMCRKWTHYLNCFQSK